MTIRADILHQVGNLERLIERDCPINRLALLRIIKTLRNAAIEAGRCELMIDELVDIANEELDQQIAETESAQRRQTANVVPLRARFSVVRNPDSLPPIVA